METQKPSSLLSYILLHRRFALGIAMVLVVGFAIRATLTIPVEVMPQENTPPFLFLRANALEKSRPELLETTFTLAVEGAVRTVPGVVKINSNTNSSGVSVSINFVPRTNLDLATINLQNALQPLEDLGLLDMKNVSMSRLNPEATAIQRYAISTRVPVSEIQKTLKEELIPGFESLDEVSKVEVVGAEPPIFEYQLKAGRLKELGLSTESMTQKLNFNNHRESLGSTAGIQGRGVLPVKSRQLLNSLSEVRDQNLSTGSFLSLTQVASESVYLRSEQEVNRKNLQNSMFLEVFNKDGANLFELDKKVKNKIEKFKEAPAPLSNLAFESIMNRVDDLRVAIDDVFSNLAQAVIITFLIVFIFIRRLKDTLIISISIPLTLLLTVWVMSMKGLSLNILTLSGLILGIGMVVDNAVLVVDRARELQREGLTLLKACAFSASESKSALLMSTITNAAIFIPVAFIEGGDSFTDILKSFQVPILGSLFSSLFVALLLIPFIISLSGKGGRSKGESVSPYVVRGFRWLVKRQRPLSLCALLFCVGLVFWCKDMSESDLGTPRDPFVGVNAKFSSEISPQKRKKMFEDYEGALVQAAEQLRFKFVVSEFNPQNLTGSLTVYPLLADEQDLDDALSALEVELKKFNDNMKFPAGITISLGWSSYGEQKIKKEIQYTIAGPRLGKIRSLLKEMKEKMMGVNGVVGVKTDEEEQGQVEILFIPHSERMASLGLKLKNIASEISSAMSEISVSALTHEGRDVGARISFVPQVGAWTLESLKNIPIKVSGGVFASFGSLGSFEFRKSLGSFSRQNRTAKGRLIVEFNEQLSDDLLNQSYAQARKAFNAFSLPEGYSPPQDDSAIRIQEMRDKSNFILLFSTFLIYVILGTMFESFFVPLSVMFSVPLALLFGVGGLRLFNMDLDVMARLSLVILVGIGVNNAIILIDLIRELRSKGLGRSDAIVQACSQRFVAISMTTLIQVVSLFPVALGKSKLMGVPYASMGISIIVGMLGSTLITLIVLPVIYSWLDDVESGVRARFGLSLAEENSR